MAFTVTLYQFQKRKNSTLQPSALQGVELNCELKQPTSYKNPVFTFFVEDGFSWNYLQWDEWYYFITDVVSVRNDLFEVHCRLDVLATYKAEIGATSAFVLYDTTANTEIIDTRLSQKTTATVMQNSDSFAFAKTGCVVLGIVGGKDAEGGKGNTGMFALTEASAAKLLDSVSSWVTDSGGLDLSIPSSVQGIDGAAEYLVKGLYTYISQFLATGKAPDCIKSAIWLPVSVEDFFGSYENIYLGQYNTGVEGRRLSVGTANNRNVTVAIPWQATDWRRNAPYHQIYVAIDNAGIVAIPPSEIIDCSSLLITAELSASGAMRYEICRTTGNAKPIMTLQGQIGGSYLVGSSNINPVTAMAGSMGGLLGFGASLGAPGTVQAIGGGAASIMGAMSALQPVPHSVGGGGGGFVGTYGVTVTSVFHDTNVAPDSVAARIGTPSMAVKTIGSLSGFIQTRAASVNASCYDDVRTEINTLMDGGFFYE